MDTDDQDDSERKIQQLSGSPPSFIQQLSESAIQQYSVSFDQQSGFSDQVRSSGKERTHFMAESKMLRLSHSERRKSNEDIGPQLRSRHHSLPSNIGSASRVSSGGILYVESASVDSPLRSMKATNPNHGVGFKRLLCCCVLYSCYPCYMGWKYFKLCAARRRLRD